MKSTHQKDKQKISKANALFDKAVKAIGSPYSGGFVSWRDIAFFNHIKSKEGCIFHERKEQGLDGEYQILVIMRKV